MGYPREFLSPRIRGVISREVQAHGSWSGTRAGVKMTVELSAQPTLTGERITWQAKIGSSRRIGTAQTISKALDQIADERTR